MAQRRLLECAFLIPVRRDKNLSDGERQGSEAWEWLDDELYVRFGGRTIAPGLYKGIYEDPDTGERVPDRSRKYIVALGSHKVRELRALLKKRSSSSSRNASI